ncbi:MAG: HAD-IA family hydrolase [Gammaproteobacteria bacterium]|nr:HAD-IA family hydrolase [Gammaproteobacteria bacterium]
MLDFDRYRILTFDCYGTLIDWETGILAALEPVFARHGVEANSDEVLEMYAKIEAKHEQGDYVRYELLLRLLMAEMSLRLGFDASVLELNCLSGSIKDWLPFPDTVESLVRLKSRFKLAIISNIDDRLFEGTAPRLEVAFDWVVTSQQAQAYKPGRQTFEHALARFNVPREQILHVAQSVYHDIEPAKALGMSTVWVNRRRGREGSGATPPAKATPDLEVADLRSLADLIGL